MKYFLLMIYNPLMLSYYNYIHNDMLKTTSRVREIFSLIRCWGTLRQQIYRIRFSTLSFYNREGMSLAYFSFINVLLLHISPININVPL